MVRFVVWVSVAGCVDQLSTPPAGRADDARADGNGVVLNEILADPGTGDPGCDGTANAIADEMIELVNTGGSPVDLSGGTVSDLVRVRHVFPAGSIVPPGAALVVFGGGSPRACAGVPETTVFQTASTGTLGLNNDGDRVVVLGPDASLVGDRTYGSEAGGDQSLVLSPEATDDAPWVLHRTVSAVPWSPGTRADGTAFGTAPPLDPCGAGDLEGEALTAALRATDAVACDDYSAATKFMFVELDGADGDVECVYTGRVTAVPGKKPTSDDMNTEHSWPQSQGAGEYPAKCDLNHLYPTDAFTNGVRGNLPFGEVVVDTQALAGGSRIGRDAGGRLVFEPRDVHKGNLARSMVYFAMRYDHRLSDAERTLYQSWSAADPVDAAEVERTLAIAAHQGAGNPYVLCPDLVDRL